MFYNREEGLCDIWSYPRFSSTWERSLSQYRRSIECKAQTILCDPISLFTLWCPKKQELINKYRLQCIFLYLVSWFSFWGRLQLPPFPVLKYYITTWTVKPALIFFKGHQLWMQSRRAIHRTWRHICHWGGMYQSLQDLFHHPIPWLHLYILGGQGCLWRLHPLQRTLCQLHLPLQPALRSSRRLRLLGGNPRG